MCLQGELKEWLRRLRIFPCEGAKRLETSLGEKEDMRNLATNK